VQVSELRLRQPPEGEQIAARGNNEMLGGIVSRRALRSSRADSLRVDSRVRSVFLKAELRSFSRQLDPSAILGTRKLIGGKLTMFARARDIRKRADEAAVTSITREESAEVSRGSKTRVRLRVEDTIAHGAVT